MGDPTCWLDETCPDCGAFVGDRGTRPCPRCGLSAPRPTAGRAAGATVRRNWAGSHTYRAPRLATPTSVEEVQDVVTEAPRVRPLGSRHSFNDVADTDGVQVSLDGLPPVVEVDADAATVTVGGGATYGDVVEVVDAAGFALPNLASLPHIGVAGATATGTHGSGDDNRSLSAAVVGLDLVTGDGERRRITRADDPDLFPGCVVALGALGVVVSLDLALVPAETMHQRVYDHIPADVLADHLDAITGAADSVSCFTRWQDRVVDTVWLKSTGDPDDDPEDLFGAPRAPVDRHPIPGLSTEAVTPQLGRPGPWFQRLPHFRLGFTPSAGAEVQSEYFVARTDAVDAFEALWALGPQLDDLLQISEIRTIAADDLWLSPANGRATVALHFTWHRRPEQLASFLPVLEDALAPFGAVPHWAKAFTVHREVFANRYDRLADFAALAEQFDPEHTFRNPYLDAYLL
ncbi:FAD-binding protein [Salsipaludibacter albus]|uniref:FAD-binding protein n=1 Tax=Salsipaludibacter albus TaxID=2849650 RepID=UPI001EE48FEC|nr:FAD-binding protein [Salsipaludibacter albus]MBY5161044.1 FAD-binding protein [Salsipaludibacter albus]